MNHSLKTGFSFGLTSGIITTLGLMVGLHSGTHSRLAVIGGILTIAIADAFSDALGIHVSEESENRHTHSEIWAATISTFSSKFFSTLLFLIPILLFKLETAIIISIIGGLLLVGIFSFYIAQSQRVNPWFAVMEHIIIGLVVIALTHYAGDWIGLTFG